MCCSVPWSPHVDRHIDGAIAIAFSFSSKVEDIGYEHGRDALFIGGNIASCIKPSNGATNRSFQFADSNRETVYQENNIQTFAAFGLRVYPLIGYNVFVESKVLFEHSSEETDRNHASILSERIGVFFKNQLLEDFVLSNKIVRLNGQDGGSEFINNFIGTRRVFCDFRVKANESLFYHRLDKYIRMHTRELFRRNVFPSISLKSGKYHLLNSIVFIKTNTHIVSSHQTIELNIVASKIFRQRCLLGNLLNDNSFSLAYRA